MYRVIETMDENIIKTPSDESGGRGQYVNAASSVVACLCIEGTAYVGVGFAHGALRPFVTILSLGVLMFSYHVVLQFGLFREAMVFAVDSASKTASNLAHQWSMPRCLMLIQLIFAAQIGASRCLTARLGAIFGLIMLGKAMSF
jgi:hypothetical protein